jgi:hypothetical protein
MSDSESSALSSAPSEDEIDLQMVKKDGILKFFSKSGKPGSATTAPTPPRIKRAPSPPHEFVLADNPDIAVSITLFYRALDGIYTSRRVGCNLK